MPNLSRLGDTNNTGGQIMRGAKTVFCNGIAVGLHVSQITSHSPRRKWSGKKHRSAKTTEGSPTVFCEGVPVLRVGSGNTCGHTIVKGSPNVFCP